ncbi:MAG: right-handed parallel beta-helix repeat-containing protein [Candidatus Kariarchaeaceae archaeon]|jgi:parallel beta-helix repeat protein
MKTRSRTLLLAVLLLTSIGSLDGFFSSGADLQPLPISTDDEQVYTPHSIISINSNEEFLVAGFPGSGIKSDPYRIEYLNITNSVDTLISIANTDFHFRISNNYLNGLGGEFDIINLYDASNGILEDNILMNSLHFGIILNAKNCLVNNNTIMDVGVGIEVQGSHNVVSNNYIGRTSEIGISVFGEGNQRIIANHIQDATGVGILIDETRNIWLENNQMLNNGMEGVWVGYCDNITIASNTITQTKADGSIILFETNNSLIINNSIVDNYENGIILERANFNLIHGNLLQGNRAYAFIVGSEPEQTQANIIAWNDFIDNRLGGTQASDDSGENIFHHNYWNDLQGDRHAIAGRGKSEDRNPLSDSLFDKHSLYLFQQPLNQTFNGRTQLQWKPRMDYATREESYSLYYLSNGAVDWKLLVSDLTSNEYSFNTEAFTNDEYLFRIVAYNQQGQIAEYTSDHVFEIHNQSTISTLAFSPVLTTMLALFVLSRKNSNSIKR